MQKTKETHAFLYILCLFLAVFLVAVLPVAGEEALYDDVLRLHILANSDSEEDQALKLTVRDEILALYGDRLGACNDKAAAEKEVLALQEDIRQTAEATVRAAGYTYPVAVSLSRESYPTRDYEDVSLPAGSYASLRLVIGKGEGQNWWCVLFPPMCVGSAVSVDDSSIPVGLSPAEYRLISEGGSYRIKFKILEMVEGWFS